MPGLLALLGLVLIVVWVYTGSVAALAPRTPGLDHLGSPREVEVLPPPEPGEPVFSDGKPSDLPGSWPWFRGPDLDGICHDSVPLARKWPEGGPPILWTAEMGPGHAGAAIADGCVYVLDYDTQAQADVMRCLSLEDGTEIWRNGYPVELAEWHGMSRTVPAVVDGCVVSFGPKCHVACWDQETGQCKWLIDLIGQYGSTMPQWYAGQCPLVDNGRVILAPTAKSFMIAVDLHSGKTVWESKRLHNWEMTHASIAVMEFNDQRMYVTCGTGGVAGISHQDGSMLWESTDWVTTMATCPTPVYVGDGRIFLSSGYHKSDQYSSLMLQLEESNGRLTTKTLYGLKPRQFEAEQHTPIFYDGHLFGARTKPGGDRLVCLDLEGNVVWHSGGDKVERGPYMIADGLIFAMNSKGTLFLAEATHEAYRPLGRFDVFDGFGGAHDAWAPMALASGRLVLRDLKRMVCIDVAE